MCVNPGSAFNCYWQMPFRRRARITITNESEQERLALLPDQLHAAEVPDDAAYFHAQFRRVNPLPDKATSYTILDGVRGRGQYVGTYWPGA